MSDEEKRYTVTVYIAAPGTRLLDENGAPTNNTSLPGHMYYSLSGGGEGDKSYGFAPKEEGSSSGPGKINEDAKVYANPYYSRTMEISKEQYDKMRDFGDEGVKESGKYFNMEYKGLKNSCIDFTYAALKHGGINTPKVTFRDILNIGLQPPFIRSVPFQNAIEKWTNSYEGHVRVLDNVGSIKSIKAPFPGSDLNKSVTNPMLERDGTQWLLSDYKSPNVDRSFEQVTAILTGDPDFDALVACHNNPEAMKNAGEALAQSAYGQQFYQEGHDALMALNTREMVQQQERAQQEKTNVKTNSYERGIG